MGMGFLVLNMYIYLQSLSPQQSPMGCFSLRLAKGSLSLSHIYIEGLWNALQHIS